eukprot:6471550-Amphidinium_carterae.2
MNGAGIGLFDLWVCNLWFVACGNTLKRLVAKQHLDAQWQSALHARFLVGWKSGSQPLAHMTIYLNEVAEQQASQPDEDVAPSMNSVRTCGVRALLSYTRTRLPKLVHLAIGKRGRQQQLALRQSYQRP